MERRGRERGRGKRWESKQSGGKKKGGREEGRLGEETGGTRETSPLLSPQWIEWCPPHERPSVLSPMFIHMPTSSANTFTDTLRSNASSGNVWVSFGPVKLTHTLKLAVQQ